MLPKTRKKFNLVKVNATVGLNSPTKSPSRRPVRRPRREFKPTVSVVPKMNLNAQPRAEDTSPTVPAKPLRKRVPRQTTRVSPPHGVPGIPTPSETSAANAQGLNTGETVQNNLAGSDLSQKRAKGGTIKKTILDQNVTPRVPKPMKKAATLGVKDTSHTGTSPTNQTPSVFRDVGPILNSMRNSVQEITNSTDDFQSRSRRVSEDGGGTSCISNTILAAIIDSDSSQPSTAHAPITEPLSLPPSYITDMRVGALHTEQPSDAGGELHHESSGLVFHASCDIVTSQGSRANPLPNSPRTGCDTDVSHAAPNLVSSP